jgi:hypothetical protein
MAEASENLPRQLARIGGKGSNCLFRFAFNAAEPAIRVPSCSLRSRTSRFTVAFDHP